MKNVFIIAISFVFVLFMSCNKKAEFPADWKMYEEKEYSIHYPDSFKLDQSEMMGSEFSILFESETEGEYPENINLTVENLPGSDINLDMYAGIAVPQIESEVVDGNVTENITIEVNGEECQKVVFTGKFEKYSLKWQQYCWIKNYKAYVLTFTSDADEFDENIGVGQMIMNSFILK